MISQKMFMLIQQISTNNPPNAPTWNTEKVNTTNWNCINSFMLYALKHIYEYTQDVSYLVYIKNFLDFYITENGDIHLYKFDDYDLDNINIGKLLFLLDEHFSEDKRYRLAINLLYKQLHQQPRIIMGNFFHKSSCPNQIWLDGLYSAMPFYMEYEIKFNNGKNCTDIYKQFLNVNSFLRDRRTGLYYHAYDDTHSQSWANRQFGTSSEFWLGSIAWFAMALVDTAEFRPKDNILPPVILELFETLEKYQDPSTCMWYQIVDKANQPGNYLETSGSAAIAYAMMKAYRLNFVSKHFYLVGKKAFEGICNNKLFIYDNGFIELKDICVTAGLGGTSQTNTTHPNRDGSFEYYITEKFTSNNAKGIAPLILAYVETLLFENS